MTIYDYLKREHRHVAQLIKQAKKYYDEDPEKAFKVFEDIKKELVAHAKAEETMFYLPLKKRMKKAKATEDVILEGTEEHHVITLLLKEMSLIRFVDKTWGAKLHVLEELIEHHVKEEESDIFELAQEYFSFQEAKDMYKETRSLKEELLNDVDFILDKEVSDILPVNLNDNNYKVRE